MANILLTFIGAYRRVNHALVGAGFPLTAWSGCRQWPTCSEYTAYAVGRYGVMGGLYRALVRMLHCHPLRLSHS